MKKTGGDTFSKNMTSLDAWGMAFGCMVGWGVFVMPGTTFLPVAGPVGTIIAFAIGMAIMLVIGSNFTFLMNRSSRAGGVYSYTKEAFGRDHAFLSSWFLCLSYLTIVFLNGTALFIVIRTIFGNATQTGFSYTVSGNKIYFIEFLISVAALVGTGILCIIAKNAIHKIQTVLSIVLLVGIIAIEIICIPHSLSAIKTQSFGFHHMNAFHGIFSIVFLAPWAFVGFDTISFDTQKFNFPIKKTRPVIVTSIIAATFAYGLMPLVGVSVVPDNFPSWKEYVDVLESLDGLESVPTFFAAKSIIGNTGLVIACVTAFAAVLTGIIGGFRATINVLSTMAEDKILSKFFSKPVYNIIFIMIISIIIAFLGRNTLNWFIDLTSFGAIVGFGYTSAATYKIAKTEKRKMQMATGMIGTVISVIFVIVQLVPSLTAMEAMGAEAFLLLALWCLLGFAFYWRTIIKSSLTQFSGISTSGVVLFALLLYSALMWLIKSVAAKSSIAEIHKFLIFGGIVIMLLIFLGLGIMLYIPSLVRKKHELSEREKIRAVEGSLAKSQFLFNMSHDIRTPMNAIIGYTNLALKETDEKKVHEFLEKIDNSNQHLLTLINDILEMSRIESGKVELEFLPTDLNDIFEGIKDLFSQKMEEKGLDFQVHYSNIKDHFVWCDSKNLNRVLTNLLSNAYKFTDKGGQVSASISQTEREENSAMYEIRIRDTGRGMSKEFVEKMFNPFERERTSTDSKIEGTGLGLAICKNIMDMMDGTIEVFTAIGSGTEIVLHLKFNLAKEEEIKKNEEEKNALPDTSIFAGKRILLVEDNEINMEIAKMILNQYGFIVESAENGQIALDMVTSADANYYDAILMDIQMPIMDGYTATKKIRELEDKEKAEIPILAMTANAFAEDVEKAKSSGMQGHIAKPVDIKQLLKELASVLEK